MKHQLPQINRLLPKYWFVPDIHGQIKYFAWLYHQANILNVSSIIQLGDFGWSWPGSFCRIDKMLRETTYNIPISFIPGNHDNWTKIDKLRVNSLDKAPIQVNPNLYILQRGSIVGLDCFNMFCFGGAESSDSHYRSPDKKTWYPHGKLGAWWHHESPTDDDIQFARTQLTLHASDIDLVVTHDAPLEVRPQRYGGSTNQWSGYPTDYTARILSSFLRIDNFNPNLWLYGHHHNFNMRAPTDTTFICGGRFDGLDCPSSLIEISTEEPEYKHFRVTHLLDLEKQPYKVFLLEKK